MEETQEITMDDDDDDDEEYNSLASDSRRQDRGTEKTKELLSMFQQRHSPLRGKPSPIRTESTMATSIEGEEEDGENEQDKKLQPVQQQRPPPLLPQRSD